MKVDNSEKVWMKEKRTLQLVSRVYTPLYLLLVIDWNLKKEGPENQFVHTEYLSKDLQHYLGRSWERLLR